MAKKKKTAAPKKSAPLKKNKPKKDSNSGKGFPIVGIGASAGGLAAFEAFFSAIPDDKQTGMAFVLVQHLAPGHKSELSHLIQRCTHLPATEARDRMRLEPDHIYTIPSNRYLAVRDGALQLTKPQDERGHRHPVDFLFRSLADDRHEQAVGIVLSGTASDGTQGVRDVKCAGGMVMVQDPDTAEYDGMPRNAMATGQVDYVLAPDEMPAKLAGYFTHKSGKTALSGPSATSTGSGELNNVFGLLRSQTGHDFSKYKQTTINRRIERRMTVQQISRLEEYVRYLRETPDEVTVLFRDLLIGVTRFFRDPEMFDALKRQVIPGLFEDKQPGTEVRVWVPGCSTGEEAYSIAILLREHIEGLDRHYKVQVFATDIDSRAIHTARIGAYPAGIVGDISEERLKRFFTKGPDGDTYRIGKSIRDLLIFSEQNVINDPPFSRLDLVSCRNLLIYMGEKLQKKLIPLFHYALKPDGMLFLGTSESVGEFTGLFTTLDAKAKLYRKQKDGDHGETGKFPPWPEKDEKTATPHIEGNKDSKPVTNNHDLTVTALLQHYNPAAVLVDEQGAVRYIHGRSGRYLEPAPGGDGMNILKMAREGLRRDLTAALGQAADEKETMQRRGLHVKTNGAFITVNLTIRPVPPSGPRLFLVILEEAPETDTGHSGQTAPDAETKAPADEGKRVAGLKEKLRAKEEHLVAVEAQMQTANEELKSSIEELQSTNEEMQSTNEELETSREELQSVNEELVTVNGELHTKVDELTQAEDDMKNMLAGTGVATVFVDMELCIRRYTPASADLVNLIGTDVGRPIDHITSNLTGYNHLTSDIHAVLDTLETREIEVQSNKGSWYLLRIRPYRTQNNVIDGAVITFTEVTQMKAVQAKMKSSEALRRLATVALDAYDAIIMVDLEGRIMAWNPAAVRLYGWSESQALEMNHRDIVPEDLQEKMLTVFRRLAKKETVEPYRAKRITKNGSIVEVWLTITALIGKDENVYAYATTERKIKPTN